MVEKNDENAKLIAHLHFIGGQVNMLMDLCLAFISANPDPEKLAQRFEATVNTSLVHNSVKVMPQEFIDGELDIVNRVRCDVMSALPRKAKATETKVVVEKTVPSVSIASRPRAAKTIERIYHDIEG
jgi:hypothetical protein